MMKIKYTLQMGLTKMAFFMAIGLSFVACTPNDAEDVLFNGDEYQNILQYIDANLESYSSFRQIIEVARLADVLSAYNSNVGGNGYTLFLPDNAAVDNFIGSHPQFNSLNEMLDDTVFTKELVRYHILNVQVNALDFPNGVLPDKTLSDDYLTINFRGEGSDVSYAVNDDALITVNNIEKNNGIIHLIDKMLLPVVYTGYEWVQAYADNGYSIFAQLLEITGLEDTLNYYELDELNRKKYNEYTLFVESDELYRAHGVNSLNDLIERVKPTNTDYANPDNKLNKFARYHILIQSYFLDEFNSNNYNTYGDYPIAVEADIDLKVNIGTEVFEKRVVEGDTIDINYLLPDLEKSNVLTKTGAIHQLDHILHPYLPGRTNIRFEFYDEKVISEARAEAGTYYLRQEQLTKIDLFGTDFMYYFKSATTLSNVRNRDYVTVQGNFEFTYTTPKILTGAYEISITAHRNSSANAMVYLFVDGVQIGSVIDLTSGSTHEHGFSPSFIPGTVEFSAYKTHEIKLSAFKAGYLNLDRIDFVPISSN